MQITQLTITYSRTQSLQGYSNIKPGVSLTAALGDGDDVDIAAQTLLREAHRIVHDQIDSALEHDGQRPMFTSEPLYWIAGNFGRRVYVILPASVSMSDLAKLDHADPEWNYYQNDFHYRGWFTVPPTYQRLQAVLNQISLPDGYDLIFCTDGNLAAIPRLPVPAPAANDEEE